MTDGEIGAAVLDALVGAGPPGNPGGGAAGGTKLDGLDLRAETLSAAVEGRPAVPAWWDAGAGRVSVPSGDLSDRSLRGANLTGGAFERANFTGTDLATAVLRAAVLGGAVFDRALLEEADLEGASLRFATFREAVLEGANLRGADLWGAKLPEADADKADFRDAQLEEADFRDADARAADFRGARLGLSDFRGTDLRMADFRGCQARATKFDGADLRRSNLEQVDLTNTSLTNIWLSDARLDRTRFHHTQLGGALGEELAEEYDLARRGYLSLERNFADTGDPEGASWAYRRRRRMEKLSARRQAGKALRGRRWGEAAGAGLRYANLKTVELVCDYGESVPRVLASQVALVLAFALLYAAVGGVHRDGPDGRAVTRTTLDIATYSITAMVAPNQPPEGLRPSDDLMQLITLTQSCLSIFLIGLLGFVAGNRIRR
jgi:uncharacterized protein YjbI with pentapeptide repeats